MTEQTTATDGVSRRRFLQTSVLTLGALGSIHPVRAGNGGVITQRADVFGQGPDGSVVAQDGATLRRTTDGLSMTLTMPTPEPGTYTYPSGPPGGAWTDEPGHPEVFSMWCFVFDPEQPAFNPPVAMWTGVYSAAGHAVGGSTLTLSGHVSTTTETFAGQQLENPMDAEVHLAVAPHGALDSEHLPEAFSTPTGPGPDIWWIALFDPPV